MAGKESTSKEKQAKKPYLSLEKDSLAQLFYLPFKVYWREFLSFYILALLPEFLLFGIFRLITIRIPYYYGGSFFGFEMDLAYEGVARYLIPLAILTVLIFFFRSSVISNMSWRIANRGKSNPVWALDRSFKQSLNLLFGTIILVFFLSVPSMFFILGDLLLLISMYWLGWLLIALSVGILIILGSRLCLSIAVMSKENVRIGTALQTSWDSTADRDWLKIALVLFVFSLIGIIFPWVFSLSLGEIYGFWAGFGAIFLRALLYPLFDISLTLSYLNSANLALERSVFKEDIKKTQTLQEFFTGEKPKDD
ncbi:MAG: hypothetical protein U9O98_03220 [Asgard group archaeon]|nr:hypothetical protein [Asgard group archaeon]